jgi:hypothetical protein
MSLIVVIKSENSNKNRIIIILKYQPNKLLSNPNYNTDCQIAHMPVLISKTFFKTHKNLPIVTQVEHCTIHTNNKFHCIFHASGNLYSCVSILKSVNEL